MFYSHYMNDSLRGSVNERLLSLLPFEQNTTAIDEMNVYLQQLQCSTILLFRNEKSW